MLNKSSLFLILLIVPIALSTSEIYNKLENTEEGKSIINTILIQTKLQGDTADSIRNVLNTSQQRNTNAFTKYERQAKKAQDSCARDTAELKKHVNENISKKFAVEKTVESTVQLKAQKTSFSADLQSEITAFGNYVEDVTAAKSAWKSFYDSMTGSLTFALNSLKKIRTLVNVSNPQLAVAAAFVEVKNKESLSNEIRSELEFKFYDILGMKPILTNLLEVAAKGISAAQFHKVQKTIDLIEMFLLDRQNNLIEDNEYQIQISDNLVGSLNDSVSATKNEREMLAHVVSGLNNRLNLLNVALNNSNSLVASSKNVLAARENICAKFNSSHYRHTQRYHNVRLTVAELSNALGDEYKEFRSFIEKKISN